MKQQAASIFFKCILWCADVETFREVFKKITWLSPLVYKYDKEMRRFKSRRLMIADSLFLSLLINNFKMIYIGIDNSTPAAKKMVELIEEMPFATVYREFNKTTEKAFEEIKQGKVITAKNADELLKKLKD